ncbi:unnamed protein product [Brassica rapa subsp. narinosa]
MLKSNPYRLIGVYFEIMICLAAHHGWSSYLSQDKYNMIKMGLDVKGWRVVDVLSPQSMFLGSKTIALAWGCERNRLITIVDHHSPLSYLRITTMYRQLLVLVGNPVLLTYPEVIDAAVIPFKLIANVKDDSGEANFLLFDTNAQMIDEDPDFLPEAVSDLFGKRMLFEISVDSDNIRGKSSQYLVCCANDDREMIEEFAALPHKPVLKLHGSDEISDGSGGSSATHVSKRKSKGEEDNDFEDQLSVKKKQGPKKIKGE